jgi:hypothetical protein
VAIETTFARLDGRFARGGTEDSTERTTTMSGLHFGTEPHFQNSLPATALGDSGCRDRAQSGSVGLLKNPSALRCGLSKRAVGGITGRFEKRVRREDDFFNSPSVPKRGKRPQKDQWPDTVVC